MFETCISLKLTCNQQNFRYNASAEMVRHEYSTNYLFNAYFHLESRTLHDRFPVVKIILDFRICFRYFYFSSNAHT